MSARAKRRAAALFGLLFAMSCASVIGVPSDSRDAVHSLCQCSPGPFTAETCEASLGARIDHGAPKAVADWLVAAKACIDDCPTAQTCYRTPPACTGENGDCTSDSECCMNLSCLGSVADAGSGKTCR